MCWHGCFEIQINDRGQVFLNEVCKQRHELTEVEQRVMSAYHPWANELVERQIRTIKISLVQVLKDNPEIWRQITEGILLAHRVSRHYSTKYFPFLLIYNHEPVLPIGVKHNLNKDESKDRENREGDGDKEQPFDLGFFVCCLLISDESPNNNRG